MTNSKALPVRVLVKGPSTVLLTSMMGGPRTDLAFPRVIESELLQRGRACEVINGGVLGWPTAHLFKTWDVEIAAGQPDVVILAVGQYETLHAILPRWLERRANTEHRRPGFNRWKRLFFRVLARGALKTQRRVDGPWLKRTRRIERAVAEVQAYIDMTARFGSPLILLMEFHEPTKAKQDWFPGWVPRIRVLNAHLRKLSETNAHKNVQYVAVNDLMDQFQPGDAEQLWADGIHFSPEFHRAAGVRFADIVEDWAENEPLFNGANQPERIR